MNRTHTNSSVMNKYKRLMSLNVIDHNKRIVFVCSKNSLLTWKDKSNSAISHILIVYNFGEVVTLLVKMAHVCMNVWLHHFRIFIDSPLNFPAQIETFRHLYFLLRLTHPTPGIEHGGRMRCAIISMNSVSATLDTLPRW